MARFKIGDRVRVNVTIGSIYDKTGTITDYAQLQYAVVGQIYAVPRWKILMDTGKCIELSEKYLCPVQKQRE